jgi:D-3-phosphoglycerate dehydrogenase
MSGAPKLRATVRHGAGLDMIPVDAATAAGVLVSNAPGANASTVAEYVLFSALALKRRFRMIDHDLRAQGWAEGRRHADAAGEISGTTIGIIGMGSIGKAIAKIAAGGFSMRVLGHSRSNRNFPANVEPVTLADLLAQSDVVVLACPLNAETRDLIGEQEFARMKQGAILVNVSRGPVVVEAALLDALSSGHLGGAALDVFAEQPLPRGHPLFRFPNVTLTPHCAGITDESMLRMGLMVTDDIARILNNDLPTNLRNPEAVPAYRRRFPG